MDQEGLGLPFILKQPKTQTKIPETTICKTMDVYQNKKHGPWEMGNKGNQSLTTISAHWLEESPELGIGREIWGGAKLTPLLHGYATYRQVQKSCASYNALHLVSWNPTCISTKSPYFPFTLGSGKYTADPAQQMPLSEEMRWQSGENKAIRAHRSQ